MILNPFLQDVERYHVTVEQLFTKLNGFPALARDTFSTWLSELRKEDLLACIKLIQHFITFAFRMDGNQSHCINSVMLLDKICIALSFISSFFPPFFCLLLFGR